MLYPWPNPKPFLPVHNVVHNIPSGQATVPVVMPGIA
jgi:hypothetical protein